MDVNQSAVAVVVTRDRPEALARLLASLATQTLALSRIVVVDNGMLPETRAVLDRHRDVLHMPSRRNLGGAGGFVLGIMQALALGADLVWLMDDDGVPEGAGCLEGLTQHLLAGGYDMVSPLILDIAEPRELAFFYYVGGRPKKRRDELAAADVLPQFAHLFNGALVTAEAFRRYGLPRYELFFRGDETDWLFRLNRDGARFCTVCSVAFLHPSGRRDTVPIMGGRYHAIIPPSDAARLHYYRNRGNLFREFRLGKAAAVDLVRYAWAFGITRRGDVKGFREWLAAVRQGWRRDFTPPR